MLSPCLCAYWEASPHIVIIHRKFTKEEGRKRSGSLAVGKKSADLDKCSFRLEALGLVSLARPPTFLEPLCQAVLLFP
jgi:hypothetical protein